MGQGATAFLLGILAFQQMPSLPPLGWVWPGAALMLALAMAARAWPLLRLPAWMAWGFLWTLVHAHQVLSVGLAPELEGQDLLVEGVIAAIPERQARATRLELDVEALSRGGEALPLPGRIRLSWYNDAPTTLAAGERWRLKVRLKRPRGFSNAGAFDYEGWLYRKRIRATGYVRSDPLNARIEAGAAAYPLQRLRQRLGERIAGALPGRELHGVVIALAIGDYQHIERAQWDTFRRTGTTHLVAISGLHVGMVAGMLFFAVRWAWGRSGSCALKWPAPYAGAVAAMCGALGYSALAGFSVPTQRSMIMVAVVMGALLMQRHRALSHTFMTALFLVLLYDPLAVMDSGFWLSFGAVAIILFGMSGRIGANGWWWRWGRLHVLVTIGLAPPLVVLFQEFPLASPIANFIAVPWVSLAVVPLVLLGAALLLPVPAAGGSILGLAEWLLALLWPILDGISAADWSQWSQHAPNGWALAASLIGVVLLLAPRGLPGRWLGVVWLLPALLLVPPRPLPGEAWLTLLDVGQGLAAVVRTSDHVLVYDTGARFGPDFDAGGAVVLPYLRHQGIGSIDTLVISHGDNDHVGGAATIAQAIEPGRVISGEVHRVSWPAEPCVEGQSWQWDGVRFDIVHPAPDAAWRGNNASCVLLVEAGGARIMLTGDIEAPAEAVLLRSGHDLAAQVLVAPHHGSRTSSTAAFVRAVAPDYVLFPAGYRNRWGFPHPEVVERYTAVGARPFGSAEHGAVTVGLSADGTVAAPRSYRRLHARYWHDDAP